MMINVRVVIYTESDFVQATQFCFMNKIDFTYQSFHDVGFLYIHNMKTNEPVKQLIDNFDACIDASN